MATTLCLPLYDPRRETWAYCLGRADYHRNGECPFAAGSGAAFLWAAGRQEEANAERYADRAEKARVEAALDARAA